MECVIPFYPSGGPTQSFTAASDKSCHVLTIISLKTCGNCNVQNKFVLSTVVSIPAFPKPLKALLSHRRKDHLRTDSPRETSGARRSLLSDFGRLKNLKFFIV